jgi:hypothetical protein
MQPHRSLISNSKNQVSLTARINPIGQLKTAS